jgi:hypothetical protein
LEQVDTLFGDEFGNVFKTTEPVPPQEVGLLISPIVGATMTGFEIMQAAGPPLHLPPVIDLFTVLGGEVLKEDVQVDAPSVVLYIKIGGLAELVPGFEYGIKDTTHGLYWKI